MGSPQAKRQALVNAAGTSPVRFINTEPAPQPAANLSSILTATSDPLNTFADALNRDEWPKSIENVVKAVVSIHFSSVTPFDTEGTYVSEATGFVVDAERGIIMTNRHVVGPGPFMGYAVFDNHEELQVKPVYRDPVHDFGFLKYDPQGLKYMQLKALELKPEKARVGCEIRVVGNDAGEKLSILSGFISRVDRNAPVYGDMTYNDFNTEYIQAAASASGGSSGSPVVDCKGDVVALQAGGSSVASTDFFLPLYRAKRVLNLIQAETPVSRGTIQVRFVLHPYDECIRLGLTEEQAGTARKTHPESTGMLVAETVLPQGPSSDGQVLEGDCLLEINSKSLCKFRTLEEILDENVGQKVVLTLVRDGKLLHNEVEVQNLFEITPDRFVRVAGAVFHNLSYQIAAYFSLPVKGVYIAYTGTYFNPTSGDNYTGWLLDELDFKATPDLDTFVEVVLSIPTNKRVSAKFRHVSDPHTVVTSIVTMNRQWADGPQDFELAVCNNTTGLWDFTQLGPGESSEVIKKESATFVPLVNPSVPANIIALDHSIVNVTMLRPAVLEGYTISECHQHGFVIDAKNGLVLVSRFCVPHYLVDLSIVIADSVILPAKVVFLHPQLGYAVIQYNPELIDADLRSIEFCEQEKNSRISQGTKLCFFGYVSKGSPYAVETKVTDISTMQLPTGFNVAPRFRATNVDAISVDSSIIPEIDSGLLADPETGKIRAICMSFLGDVNSNTRRDRIFRFAIDAETVSGVVNELKQAANTASPTPNEIGNPFIKVDPRFLDLEVRPIKFASARICKVPDEWIHKFEKVEIARLRPQLLQVSRVASTLAKTIYEGDVLLEINNELAINVAQLYNLPEDMRAVQVTLVRKGEVTRLEIPTSSTSETVTKSLVSWCGMTLHKPHHGVLQQVKTPPSQVYVVSSHSGSPANMYDLYPTTFITHVNDEPTPDLDTLYEIVKAVPDNTYVKLRVVNFDGVPQALSLRTNYHYFPTWRIDLDTKTGEWKKHKDT